MIFKHLIPSTLIVSPLFLFVTCKFDKLAGYYVFRQLVGKVLNKQGLVCHCRDSELIQQATIYGVPSKCAMLGLGVRR